MDCLRCKHRLPPEEEKRGRKWHNDCPKVCADEWCSHPSHDSGSRPLSPVGPIDENAKPGNKPLPRSSY